MSAYDSSNWYLLWAFRYVLCSLDLTVYPANATYVRKAFECLGNICSMSSSHAGFIMMPVHQKQTTEPAVLKHRRQIEEFLMKFKVTLANDSALPHVAELELHFEFGLAVIGGYQRCACGTCTAHPNCADDWLR